MNELFKKLKEDKLLFRSFSLNFSVIFISFVYIILNFGSLPPFIPIFNQLPWGEQRIAKTIWIFLLPIIAFLIFGANLIISTRFYKKNPLIARLFSITSFLITVLTLLFLIRTVNTVL